MFKKKNHQGEQHSSHKSTHKPSHKADIIEARKEQLKALAKKHKKNLSTFFVILIFLALCFFAYKAYYKSQEEKYSAVLQQVLIDTEKGDNKAAKNSLRQLYENGSVPAGIRSLASLKYAAMLLNDGDTDKAVELYIEINRTKNFDPYIRELSGLLALKAMIDANSAIFDEKIKLLTDDLEKNSKTLKYFVIEQKGIYNWSHGNNAEATKIFQDLADNIEASPTVRKRAKEMLEVVSQNESGAAANSKANEPKIKDSSAKKSKAKESKTK